LKNIPAIPTFAPIGPVALAAAIHFGWATPQVAVQENFAEYDAPWRNELITGADLFRGGEYILPERPGFGVELNERACSEHPYRKHTFPSLWDERWVKEFTKREPTALAQDSSGID
jgi:galactonate dehydratase